MENGFSEFYPIPCVCDGIITKKINPSNWEIEIHSSPLGRLNGPVYASLIFSPGGNNNYKPGDYVKALVNFLYGGPELSYQDVSPDGDNLILGLYQPRQIIEKDIDPKITDIDGTNIGFRHPFSKAGLTASRAGHVNIATPNEDFISLRNGGFGSLKNSINQRAQNFNRVISHNPGLNVREQYLKVDGNDSDEEQNNTTPEGYKILFRRFVPSNQEVNSWMSTYSGSCIPIVPSNSKYNNISVNKECVTGKIFQNDDIRATIEGGELGDKFVRVRVDKVIVDEKSSSSGAGCTPAILGNLAKFNISDEGDFEILAGGDGSPKGNTYSVQIKFGKDGVNINCKEKIKFSHSENDESINSIVLDPDNGIDVTASKGFRVNGQSIVLESFVKWIDTNKSGFCQTIYPGSVAPLSQPTLLEFELKKKMFGTIGGFLSTGASLPAIGIIKEDSDGFSSV